MNKYLNIIIIAFFSILTCNEEIGFSLFIPIVLVFASCNSRSLVLMIPLSIISIYFFKNSFLLATIFLFILVVVYILVLAKKKNFLIDGIYTFLLCFGLLLLIKENININKIYIDIVYSLVCSIIYIIIKYLIKINQSNFIYFEVLAIMVSMLGSSVIDIEIYGVNIPFIIACFYCMYFTCNTGVLFSEVFAILSSIYLLYTYELQIALVLPLIAALYCLNNIFCSFLVVVIGCVVGIFYQQYFKQIIVIDIVCIFFELLKYKVVVKRVTKNETYEDVYKKSLDNLNKDVLAFSSFLDMCTKDSEINREYNKCIDDGVMSFKSNYCSRCYMNHKCLKENDYFINDEMKKLIVDCKNRDFVINNMKILGVCPYNIEMKKSALIINNRINSKDLKTKNKIINSALNNISIMLRQYTIDNSIKKEMNFDYIYKMKKALCDNGYNVCYFEAEKTIENDFEIVAGVRGFVFNDIKNDIEEILNNNMYCKISLMYSHVEKGKTYFKIIPKRNCQLEYSSSSIANGVISGDNILINESNSKTISIICDGMGKGYKANEISINIIRFLENLLKTSLSTYAIVQILNTYCSLRNDMEIYTTLDFLEIDQRTCEASFYKLSAAPSYIYHHNYNKKIEKIENNRLPLGNEKDIDACNVKLEIGDIIIMSSDGIFENIINESELENFISSITYMSVEKIVYQILNYVKNGAKLNDDDISLIVLKAI